MPRPLREVYDGAWHHVMNRGASHSDIFVDDTDRSFFLDKLVLAARLYGLDVHGYVLMSNHYHLLLHSRSGLLSKGMQRVASDYTHHFSHRHRKDGALFRGRFKSVEIETDVQLLQTIRYIHLNPVQAGMAARPEDWRWSSAAAYSVIDEKPKQCPTEVRPMGLTPTGRGQQWLDTEFILDMFGERHVDGYRDFMKAGVDEATSERYVRLGWG